MQKVQTKIAKNTELSVVKIKTEFNGFGALKNLIVIGLIVLQFVLLTLSYLYLFTFFTWLATFSFIMSLATCIYVLSTNKNSQVKGTWILFLLLCFTFGYIIYFMSNERFLFKKSRKKYSELYSKTDVFKKEQIALNNLPAEIKTDCNYLYSAGKFPAYTNCKLNYFASGYRLFDNILQNLQNAKEFIFMEFFIVSNGVLLDRILTILKEKSKQGVDIRIIYDDMGSHGTLKRKTKKEITKAGIKLHAYNKLVPIFNIALNFRDHRKIVVIDGKLVYLGGANLADEYTNEKRMHGYWKDTGIKLEGMAVDTLTLAFLRQWEFINKKQINYSNYLNKALNYENSSVVVPFVDGLDYTAPIGKDAYINLIANAKEKIYIMTPYFIPDDSIVELLKNKAQAGVDVRIILPEIADKKFVYYVTRDNAERLIPFGVKIYTMTHSFVHSKICLTENACIIGSINFDQRSFYQQFESALYTNDKKVLTEVETDYINTFKVCKQITDENKKRNKLSYRLIAGIFRIISPFM